MSCSTRSSTASSVVRGGAVEKDGFDMRPAWRAPLRRVALSHN
jgi:hypothetical protein